MKRIDLVIPCAGRMPDLLRLLRSLHSHCGGALADEVASIVVTDDRPSDALRNQLARHFPTVRYVDGPARGPAANRNHGTRHGQAPWILFLDDDCYVATDLLTAYLAQLDAPVPPPPVLEGAIRAVGERPNGNHHAPLNLEGGKLWSCNMLLRRAAFEAVGGFDERFPYACMEDTDLRERLLAAGAAMRFVPDASVLHPWRSISEGEVTRQIVSHAIYADKHPAFVREWTLLHLLRALRGRLRLYASGRFSSIAWAKYRTVAYDFMAPLMVYFAVRIGPLRRALCGRHRRPARA